MSLVRKMEFKDKTFLVVGTGAVSYTHLDVYKRQAMEVSLDKQGRILIPALLRTSAALEKEVTFVGMMNRIEVWDKNRLEAQEMQDDDEVLEEAMDELDISL